MTIKFVSKEIRDQLAKRLANLVWVMERSRDQGHDCKIFVNDEIIGDITAAAACVSLAEIKPEN